MTTIAIKESEIAEARDALADAERALVAADAEVEAARERQGLGLAVRGATIRAQVARARKQEILEVARGRLSGLTKQLAAQREKEAAERARVAGAALAGWQAELAVLDGRVGDLIQATRDALDELDIAYRDLDQRSGGKLGTEAEGPAYYLRIHSALMTGLTGFAQYYKPTPKPATTRRS